MAGHWKLRAASLLVAGVYGLHQLRYLIGYGNDADHALAAQGHAYLTFAAPLLAVTLVLAAAELIHRLARGRVDAGGPVRLRILWAGATASFVVAYSVQELIEGLVSRGHPGGLAALFDHGGWAAIPLAVAFGLVVALLLRGAARAIELAGESAVRLALPRPVLLIRSSGAAFVSAARAFARNASARGPPVPSV